MKQQNESKTKARTPHRNIAIASSEATFAQNQWYDTLKNLLISFLKF